MTNIRDASPTPGEVEYNGVRLNPTANYRLSSEIQYDDTGRIYKWSEYTLEGSFYIYGYKDMPSSMAISEDNTSRGMNEIRLALAQPGQSLQITNVGFGDIFVNPSNDALQNAQEQLTGTDVVNVDAARYFDVNWGPKTKVIKFAPIGNLTWEVVWSCTFCIYEKKNSASVTSRNTIPTFLALNYAYDFDYDYRGLCTASINGHYDVPLSFANTYNKSPTQIEMNNHLKDALALLTVVVPKNFKVGNHTFKFNAARTRVDFNYIISENEGEAFPEGIAYADIDDDWDNQGPSNFAGWVGTISGEVEVVKGYHPTVGARRILDIISSRIKQVRQLSLQLSEGGKAKPVVLVTRFKFGAKRFTRKYRFAMEYTVTGCIGDFVGASGIWEPLGTDWTKWKTTMAGAWANDGSSHVQMGSDVIITAATKDFSIGLITAEPKEGAKQSTLTFDCEGITNYNKYLGYENHIQIIQDADTYIHKAAQTAGRKTSGSNFTDSSGSSSPHSSVEEQSGKLNPLNIILGLVTGQGPLANGIAETAIAKPAPSDSPKGEPDVIEYNGTPTKYVIMRGKAMTVKLMPEVPTLDSIGDAPAEMVYENNESPRIIARIGDCPVYLVRWERTYHIVGQLDTTPLKPSTKLDWACVKPFG